MKYIPHPDTLPDNWPRFMRHGAIGSGVAAWQATLEAVDYDLTDPVGEFGDATHNATLAFQRLRGLGVDGVVGDETKSNLARRPLPRIPLAMMFDAMGALSRGHNETPGSASRAYDTGRDGFVIAAGGGMLVLEELEHARARGAKIYAEVVGYGATSDGYNMVAPSGEGAVRCMQQAISTVSAPIDYINTHGTSTPVGDVAELKAIREVFGHQTPPLSSSKSLCGHSLGAAGVQEAIHCLLMLEHGFMAGSANISELDPEAKDMRVLKQSQDHSGLTTVMTNNFGFGGTNSCLVFQRMA